MAVEAHYPPHHAHLHLLEALHVSRGRHPDWAPMLHHRSVATRLAAQASVLALALTRRLCRTLPRACATLRVLSQRYSTWASREQSELSITPTRYLYCFTIGSCGSVPHSRAPSGRGGACSGANTMTAILAGPMLACMRHLLHQAHATVMPCCSSPGDSGYPGSHQQRVDKPGALVHCWLPAGLAGIARAGTPAQACW